MTETPFVQADGAPVRCEAPACEHLATIYDGCAYLCARCYHDQLTALTRSDQRSEAAEREDN